MQCQRDILIRSKKKKNSTQERERKEDTEQLSQSTITNQCLHTTKSLIH